MDYKKEIFKIVVLSDLLDITLTGIHIDNIIDPVTKSKFRNLKKSTNSISKYSDQIFNNEQIQEEFGEFCDRLNQIINEEIEKI